MIHPAYAAGLFDGEGSVIINKVNARTHSLCCTMHLTDYVAIAALHTQYGGSLNTVKRTRPTNKQQWSWRVSGQAAAEFLAAVRPYLLIKAAQADLAVAFRAGHVDAHGLALADRSAEYERRDDFKRQMQRLNGRMIA